MLSAQELSLEAPLFPELCCGLIFSLDSCWLGFMAEVSASDVALHLALSSAVSDFSFWTNTRPDWLPHFVTEQLARAGMSPALPSLGAVRLHCCPWGLQLPLLESPSACGLPSLMEQPNSGCFPSPFMLLSASQASLPTVLVPLLHWRK